MAKLGDLARLIRAKNAGPFMLTFDVMFDDENVYRRVINAQVLTKSSARSPPENSKGEGGGICSMAQI